MNETKHTLKECHCCKESKARDQFYESTRNDDGLANYCKDCADAQPSARLIGSHNTLIAQRNALLEACRLALEVAEAIIIDELEGTKTFKEWMEKLNPVRQVVKDCEDKP